MPNLLAIPLFSTLLFLATPGSHAAVLVSESMGTVSSTTTLSAHDAADGFDNDSLVFSGNSDIRSTSASTGYTGASGAANVFLTANAASTFLISGISTLGHMTGSVDLVFGAFKSTTASDMTTLKLAYSSDGTNWTPLTIPAQTTGTNTANWRVISFIDTAIPITSTLSLRWMNEDASTSYRVDDIVLTATAVPEPAVAVMAAVGMLGMLRRRRA